MGEVGFLLSLTELFIDRGSVLSGVKLLVNGIQRAELRDELEGGLLTDAGDAGDVIRAVAHEGLDVHELVGADAVFLHKGSLVSIHRGGIPCQQYVDARRDELKGVTVTREDVRAAFLGGCLGHSGQRTEDIVGLIALHGEDIHAQHLGKRTGHRHLGAKLIGHGVATGLVFVVELMTKGRCLEIVGNGGIVGIEILDLTGQDVDQAVESVGGKAILVGQETDTVEGTVEDAVAVDAQKCFHCVYPFGGGSPS